MLSLFLVFCALASRNNSLLGYYAYAGASTMDVRATVLNPHDDDSDADLDTVPESTIRE